MSDNDAPLPRGWWALWMAVFGWLAPMGVYFVLRLQFQNDVVWAQVGPYLLVSFTLLVVLAQVVALFMAAMAWPAKSALWTVLIAVALLLWNASLLVQGLRNVK